MAGFTQESPVIAPSVGRTRPGSSPCAPSRRGPSCSCKIALNPPPNRPDPWIYDTASGQAAQFAAWQASPATAPPPTFWIPNAAWQLASPGWINAIPFFLPVCGINLYSSLNTTDRNGLPSAPSSVIQVTIGNNSSVTAINTLVKLSVSYFGIGRKKVPIASQLVSIPPNQSVTLNFPTPSSFLTETVTAGGITLHNPQQWLGVYVDLQHPYDKNLANDQAISMWMGLGTTAQGGPGGVISPAFPVTNEFSSATEQITLSILPAAGVGISSQPGPITLNPGQVQYSGFNLTVPPTIDGGTFLAPLASVVGVDSKGNFVGGLTIVGSVND